MQTYFSTIKWECTSKAVAISPWDLSSLYFSYSLLFTCISNFYKRNLIFNLFLSCLVLLTLNYQDLLIPGSHSFKNTYTVLLLHQQGMKVLAFALLNNTLLTAFNYSFVTSIKWLVHWSFHSHFPHDQKPEQLFISCVC